MEPGRLKTQGGNRRNREDNPQVKTQREDKGEHRAVIRVKTDGCIFAETPECPVFMLSVYKSALIPFARTLRL